jgi:hypothetical protein
MSNDPLDDAFLEAWNRTGDQFLTRDQIAKLFGYSRGWVQLMIIKTDAIPRRVNKTNRRRIEYGLDMRMITRKKNIIRYRVRTYIQDLYEARAELGGANPNTTEYLQALKQHGLAFNGLKRNLEKLRQLCPNDPLITDAEYWLNATA